jgi:uncharacterized protein
MGRTALITGASSGIGLELARLFAADGYDLALVARSEGKLSALSEELRALHRITAHVIPMDLARDGAADEILEGIRERGVAIDALVNNAGFAMFGRFAEDDPRDQAEMLHVNVLALTELTRRFLPEMIERGFGRILNVASTAAFQPGPLMAVYYATKAYVLSFSLAVAEEVRGTGVTVTAVCPGVTETGFQERARMQESRLVAGRRMSGAREVAEFGYREMMAGKPLAVEGTRNRLLAAGVRFVPRSLAARAVMKAQERIPGR